jgi:hypothetical protein
MTRAELDPNLKQAVAAGTPVEVFDPTTHEVYYLTIGGRISDVVDFKLS